MPNNRNENSVTAERNTDDVPTFASNDNLSKTEGIIRCPKCAATRLANSRPQSLDSLFIRFFPRRPYRCLHCYNRFWVKEPFFADSRRPWSWLLLLAILLLVGYFSLQRNTGSTQNLYSETQTINKSAVVNGSEGVETKLVSKLQAIEESLTSAPAKRLSKAQQRKMIESLGFKTPDKPVIEGQPVSKAELERRLAEAKVKAKTAERINQKKQEDLAQRIDGDPAEVQSLLKIEINFLIEQWQQAWQDGDVDRYLSFYSDQFVPADGRSYESWQTLRRNRVIPSKQIKLTLTNFDVKFNEQNTKCAVVFEQGYQSGAYQEQSRKQLILLKQQEWKIISEKEIKPN